MNALLWWALVNNEVYVFVMVWRCRLRVWHYIFGLIFQFIPLTFDGISGAVQMITNIIAKIIQIVFIEVAIFVDYAKVNGSTNNSRYHQDNAQYR